ncbi:Na+/H+ antiporter NhaA [Streptomyces sp. NPDC046984]|uniref:Na+/H+ antiporter NhaA n=1 Tax=Streptomyces sp. NPDC046984 TaxID=3155138 RepID=UPI00340E4A60
MGRARGFNVFVAQPIPNAHTAGASSRSSGCLGRGAVVSREHRTRRSPGASQRAEQPLPQLVNRATRTSSRCAGRHHGGWWSASTRWLLHSSAIQQPPRLVGGDDPERLVRTTAAAGSPSTCPSLWFNPLLAWPDIAGIGVLAGIGFTVSLLFAELSYADVAYLSQAKGAVLLSSASASLLAALILGRRSTHHRRMRERHGRGECVTLHRAQHARGTLLVPCG